MKAYELLSDKTAWLQGWPASDKNGKKVPPNSEGASHFCMLGAIEKCYNAEAVAMKARLAEHILTNNLLAELDALNACHLEVKVKNQVTISMFNDGETTTFESVQSLLKQLDI